MEFNTHVMQALSAQEQVRKRRNMTWQFVQEDVLARIQNGTWPAGELIPTETELAAEYGCARATVNRALQVLAVLVASGRKMSDLARQFDPVPQKLVNVRYTDGKSNPLENEVVKATAAEVEAALGNRGRVLLRKSGTEPLIRVMVEGEEAAQVSSLAHAIAEQVKLVC